MQWFMSYRVLTVKNSATMLKMILSSLPQQHKQQTECKITKKNILTTGTTLHFINPKCSLKTSINQLLSKPLSLAALIFAKLISGISVSAAGYNNNERIGGVEKEYVSTVVDA